MARYRVLRWQDIPSVVEAWDGDQSASLQLSQRFQDLIDAVAMRTGASESDAYLAGWSRDDQAERPGGPDAVAAEVAAELEASFETLLSRHMLPPRG
ncbi:MAG: virulence factor [Candidatus Rokubacteria bacterium]|nr:virulence factor [Candidatus Rokubacteria bacterium]